MLADFDSNTTATPEVSSSPSSKTVRSSGMAIKNATAITADAAPSSPQYAKSWTSSAMFSSPTSSSSSNSNSNTASNSIYSYMKNMYSPKEAIQRLLFGYHSKTKRTLTEEAECGDELSVQSWTKDGVDPNSVDAYGYTPLLNASVLGRLNAVTELVKSGADVNRKGAHGFTPLHAASQNGCREVVLFLLEHGADLNAQNDDLDTPMHLALRANSIEIVNMLLRHGADPLVKGFHDKNCVETADEMGLHDLAQTFEKFATTGQQQQQQQLSMSKNNNDDHLNASF